MAENQKPLTPAFTNPPAEEAAMPHVVIIGAGFAGLETASRLGGKKVRVTLIDRHNYHLFVPLLYQVATAALSPADVAQPIRQILRRHDNIEVLMAEVRGIDPVTRHVQLAGLPDLHYDRLVIATGSVYSYFGHPEWAEFAPSIKSIEDARHIRARVLSCFERAETSRDPDEQHALTTTIVVGGGPTGVEIAGAIAELGRHALKRDFRHIDPQDSRVILIEALPRILNTFPEELGDYALNALEELGVTVMTGQPVETITREGVTVGGQLIRAGTIIWGAGVQATPAAKWLGVEADRAGRIMVGRDLSVSGLDGVFAMGDVAHTPDEAGKPLPALAQVAKQQGQFLGPALAANLLEGKPIGTFHFKNRGNTAVIGRHAAIFDFGKRRLRGWFAWMLWGFVHVYLLVGFERRALVSLQWLWRYMTYQQGARLITWSDGRKPEL
ncbi:NADH dehydrogenase [Faunimonas pinastri]|uniref:NADH:ubiquinone reductase (non-electrogenic) n=1 Tax=Faunimonas pinastri TaxID=1855383 RepID=A0A1H9A5K3_9HYPH|nr:NAD(P)/FAD-dependent oxidoreductase [Faunimonas pinastri]SEP71757.1 NADH dehydrogenase [Faunimonas pinastri]